MASPSPSPAKATVLPGWRTNKIVLNNNPIITNGDSKAPDRGEASSSANELVKKLRYSMLSLKSNAMDEKGTGVDYASITSSNAYKEYLVCAQQLQTVKNLDQLTISERKSFWINLYNSLVIHALVQGLLKSFPGGTLSRLELYESASYIVGGHLLSLNDIENGILRGNRPSATPLSSPPFAQDDPRRSLSLECDPRIHFALNCGAVSCPPIAVYSCDAKELDEELTMATEGFLEDGGVIADKENQCLKLR